jgi:hypothetical protein
MVAAAMIFCSSYFRDKVTEIKKSVERHRNEDKNDTQV